MTLTICMKDGCPRKTYKTTSICSYHKDLNLYGYCEWPHHNPVVAANGTDHLCQTCRKRGTKQILFYNKICIVCNKRKTYCNGKCNACNRLDKYGACLNGCDPATQPANDHSGFCSNCSVRGGNPPEISPGRRLNSATHRWCPKCECLLDINDFYLYKKGGTKRAKRCKVCNNPNASRRADALKYGTKHIVQTYYKLCVKCWQPIEKWDADHIVPKSLGGTDSIDNLQIMCPTCNRKKHNKESIDYRVFRLDRIESNKVE